MERESFGDQEVADLLNQSYISIKVDREERPDVDHIYMNVCQSMTGHGGWPLTVIMTPDKKPFFAGTYFPKRRMYGRPGVVEILASIKNEWQRNRQKLVEHSDLIVGSLKREVEPKNMIGAHLYPEILDKAAAQLKQDFDEVYGGFGSAPKFPVPHNVLFLMRYWKRSGDDEAFSMVEKTLNSMRRGGIYDHLGFGFARYSTDEKWLVPHFEKMLYDNALLCYAYVEAYQCTGNADFARVAEEIITYVLRDMSDSEGGFYSAEDADSEGIEGKFYVWSRGEIIEALGDNAGRIFADFYGITTRGNFEHGMSILNYIDRDIARFVSEHQVSPAELENILSEGRQRLYELREQRVHPFKDDKILTAWNGLMIAALAKAARVLGKQKYADRAKEAIEFIYSELVSNDGRLFARYRNGEAAHLAYLDDYAFLLWGLLEVYETTFDLSYLTKAQDLCADMMTLFWDEESDGFYFYGIDNEALLMRPKELYDGAMPSGNSVAALSLMKLARLTADERLAGHVEKMLKGFFSQAVQYPKGYCYYLMAIDYFLTAPRQVVIAGSRNHSDTRAMLSVAGRRFWPETNVILNDPADAELMRKIMPHIAGEVPIDGNATAYICQNFTCLSPITDVSGFSLALESV